MAVERSTVGDLLPDVGGYSEEPRNRYGPRKLTPNPNPSRAVLRVQRPPPFSVWPPRTHVTLSLMEKAFCRTVRSTFRAASAMLVGTGRAAAPVNMNDGNPRRSAARVGAFSMPSRLATSAAWNVLSRLELS
jgi:hypothetical protein